ncbi:hypothetical protein BDW74DRAFT_96454 [Aspergillus multicolor]|uniref:uncharacterized protein n=1 Tax=Aspergillus multicolor TaxID=41759 RepID=UPI003CCCF8EC
MKCFALTGMPLSKFGALRHLSLSEVSLKPCEKMMSAVAIEQLQSLRLIRCKYSLEFLSSLSELQLGLELRPFELTLCSDAIYDSLEPIAVFLNSFEGLEELFIMIMAPHTWLPGILDRHRTSMKRLVFHTRRGDSVAWPDRDMPGPPSEVLSDILCLGSLQCVGLFQSPYLLRQILASNSAGESIRIIHFRDTCDRSAEKWVPEEIRKWKRKNALTDEDKPDTVSVNKSRSEECMRGTCLSCLIEFAKWAFGPTGLPNLLVIAYGNFSHDGRFVQSQALLYRTLKPSTYLYEIHGPQMHDYRLEQIQGARRMLDACQVESKIQFVGAWDASDGETDWDPEVRSDDESDENDHSHI